LLTISGEYLVSVKFNDQHIPDSPFKVYLAPSTGDIQKLNVSDLQEHGLQVNRAASIGLFRSGQNICGIFFVDRLEQVVLVVTDFVTACSKHTWSLLSAGLITHNSSSLFIPLSTTFIYT